MPSVWEYVLTRYIDKFAFSLRIPIEMLPSRWLFIYSIDAVPYYYEWSGFTGLPGAQNAFAKHLSNAGHDEYEFFHVVVLAIDVHGHMRIHSRYHVEQAPTPYRWTPVAPFDSDTSDG